MQILKLRWEPKAADYILRRDMKTWNSADGYALKAVFRMWEKTADKKYFDYCRHYMDSFINSDGTLKFENFDDTINAELLFKLYDKTKSRKYKTAARIIFNEVKKKNDFRILPFCAGYISRFSENKDFSKIIQKFLDVYKSSKDRKTGLIKSRGIASGLYTARFIEAIVSLADYLPYNYSEKKYLIAVLKNFMNSLMKYQADNGCWNIVIDKPQKQGNYCEAFSSMMILYGILRSRISCGENILRAYSGIIDEFIMLENDSFTIIKCCAPCSPLEDYNSYIISPVMSGRIDAAGAFLLMLCEYGRYKYAYARNT